MDREFWSPLLRRHGHLIPDPTMLTLLRPDCREPHSAENAMLVPRLKFLCIELARNREGLNDPQALKQEQPAMAVESAPVRIKANGEGKQQEQQQQEQQQQQQQQEQQQLVMRRTRKYSTIEVAAGAADGDDDEDVEEAVEALMAQQGIGEDASEEGAWARQVRESD